MGPGSDALEDRFRGGMLGTFCGDALGAAFEGWRPHEAQEALARFERGGAFPDWGRYTDDTEMCVALAQSLVDRGGEVDGDDIARSFLRHYDPSRGYGPGTVRTLNAISRGTPWREAALSAFGGGSYGNGSAMRAAPVGLLFHHDLEALRAAAVAQSSVTHTHPLGTAGAALQAAAVALAVRAREPSAWAPEDVLGELRAFVEGGPDQGAAEAYLERLEAVELMLDEPDAPAEVARALGTAPTCPRSVPTAIYCALVRPRSPAEAITFAVSLGGDSDTIGAMAGAISGALHGASALPEAWLGSLEGGRRGRAHVEALSDRLHATWQGMAHARGGGHGSPVCNRYNVVTFIILDTVPRVARSREERA